MAPFYQWDVQQLIAFFERLKFLSQDPSSLKTSEVFVTCEDICIEPLKRFGSIAKQSCKVLLVKWLDVRTLRLRKGSMREWARESKTWHPAWFFFTELEALWSWEFVTNLNLSMCAPTIATFRPIVLLPSTMTDRSTDASMLGFEPSTVG